MKKPELVKEIALLQGQGMGHAADQLDVAVSRIIRTLKSGRAVRLPGLGTIVPGRRWTFRRDEK